MGRVGDGGTGLSSEPDESDFEASEASGALGTWCNLSMPSTVLFKGESVTGKDMPLPFSRA